jgi:hypothetical protein
VPLGRCRKCFEIKIDFCHSEDVRFRFEDGRSDFEMFVVMGVYW